MSSQLCEVFKKNLSLKEPVLDISKLQDVQQAQARQWITLSGRFPGTFTELNDTLRETTFLLGGTQVSDVDAFVLAKASPFLQFDTQKTIEFRHVVRWADLVQHALGVDVFKPDLTVEAPREVKKKAKDAAKGKDEKKAKGKDSKDSKDSKDAKNAKPEAAAEGEKKVKTEKKKKEKKPAAPAPAAAPVTPGRIDLRVGFIQKAVKHPDADSLYVSTIDVGEPEPRTICSGLVKYVPLEDMQQRYIVVVANLKPVKMRGIVSNGMVLCASNADDGVVEFVNVPEGSKAGDKIFFEGFNEEPDAVLNPKKKIWEQLQPDFTTTDSFNVVYRKDGKDHKLVNEKGEEFKASTLKNALVR